MVGASNRPCSVPALDKKIRSSVRGTLGWDSAAYKRYLLSMPVHERRRLLNTYGEVCAVMAGRYTQWSSNLMLEWDGTWNKSNYLSAYTSQQAPAAVQELASHRLTYLDLLYAHLPADERNVYGELLSPGYLVDGSMPDIKAAYVLYKMEDVLRVEHYRVADEVIARQALALPSSREANVTDMTRQRVDEALGSLIDVPAENKDSLFARLMLNTAVNRSLLELAEHSRLDRLAAAGLVALVRHLQQLFFGGVLPRVSSLAEVRETVAAVMDLPVPGYKWRRFRGHALDKVLQRAEAVADTDQRMAQFPEAEPYRWHYALLTCLAVAWSYCAKEEHDTRLVKDNRRSHDVIDGRSQEDAETYSPNLRLYHQRQFKLLWFSGQIHSLDAKRVEQEHAQSQYLRDTRQTYLLKFKDLTLKQWAKLDAVLASLLRGSGWDQQALLVEEEYLTELR
ncbi:Uncharacterised protein [Burkholderia pseudomallei]|nr:Uncharacterised protein [Burkholderia pseudomallei]